MASASRLNPLGYTRGATWRRRGRAIGQRLLLVLVLVLVTGCEVWDTSTRIESVNTFASGVGFGLPRNWQPVSDNALHPTADFQAYNSEKDIYLIVLREDQANVTSPDNLRDQARNYIRLMESSLRDFAVGDNSPTRIRISGTDAIQYEVSGEFLGEDVAYLHNTIKANNEYYQVVAWTPRDLYNENINDMQAIVRELRFEAVDL
jgi:hypothetical protein